MSLEILSKINYGYQELEPVIVGLMAMNKSFMLIGRHGAGKTRLARALSKGYGEHGFVFYDATKDDLISVAGIPDPEALKSGRLRFVGHERSIWDKSTIVVDEITRAGKESQNLWLEILEERTCFGLPLAYRSLIATANPESYASAFQLDEALLDRFHAVVPVPDQQTVTSEDVIQMLRVSAKESVEAEALARAFSDVQAAHAELIEEGALERVEAYLGKVVPAMLGVVKEQNGPYISGRTYARNLPETLLAVAAYYKVGGASEPLRLGAIDALRYAVATKLQIKPAMLDPIHQAAESLLKSGDVGPGAAIRLEIAAPATFEQRLEFLNERWSEINESLAPDELEKVLSELLRGASKKGDQERLVELRHALERLGYQGDALRQVDGRLLIALNAAINMVTPMLRTILDDRARGKDLERAENNIEAFRTMVSQGSFTSSRVPEIRKLQKYLIDLREGDVPNDPDSVFRFFSSLDLPKP